jgi:hypothetical protein
MAAYRDNADPHVDEELHTVDVSVAKGGTIVGVLFGFALIGAVCYVMSLFAGPPPGMEGDEWMFAPPTVVIGVAAFLLHRRRARALRVVRHGEEVRLEIARDGVLLTFPLTLHGLQFKAPVGRGVSMTEVYLQLVDAKGNALMLRQVRGAIHGPYENWFAADLDKSVKSARYDVDGGGVDILAKVRAWAEALSNDQHI